MTLQLDASLFQQPPGIKGAIEDACDGITFQELVKPTSMKAYARRNSFICRLAHMGVPYSNIAKILDVELGYVSRVIHHRNAHETRIKTQSWE